MSIRRIGVVSFLLVACAIFVVLLPRGTQVRVAAAAPMNLPSAPSLTFLPFLSKAGSPVNSSNLWRFGTAKVRRPFSDYNTQDFNGLRLGWYIDFGANSNPETTNGMEYMPVVNMKQIKVLNGVEYDCCVGCAYASPVKYTMSPGTDAIATIAKAHPGWTWIIGNEQERIDVGPLHGTGSNCARQDEMLPEVYATAYHDAYTALKLADPSAQAAFGPMVQPSPLRIEYLQRVWNAYQTQYGVPMPVDVWTVHIYVYNETQGGLGADIPAGLSETSGVIHSVADSAQFSYAQQMTIGWRQWMANNGQRNKPLYTPEYGANYPPWWQDPPNSGIFPFTPTSVRDNYMYPSFNFFLNYTDANIGYPTDGNRLVQRWAWWSMDFDFGNCVSGTYNLVNSGALFYSGLGTPPNSCPFPAQGLAPWGTYWSAYVQGLPLGSGKPY